MAVGDPFYAALVGLIVLLTLNRLLLPRLVRLAWAFWPFLALDAAVLVYVGWRGFPGIEAATSARWIVAALLAVHIAQALSTWDRARWDDEKRRRPPLHVPPEADAPSDPGKPPPAG